MPRPRRSHPIFVLVVTALGVVAVIGAAIGGVMWWTSRPSGLDKFYDPPFGVSRADRGAVLREEPVTVGSGITVYRVLYRTVGVGGRARAASGFVAWPAGDPPAGGFPIVAFGHATVGLADECAPSREGIGDDNRDVVVGFVQAGFAVAGPDFPGLGPPDDPHPYLVGETSGASVIDMVRAARASAGDLISNRVVAWGYSQGAHAVLWARSQVADTAPELDWKGTVALAPIVDLSTVGGSQELGAVLTVAVLMGQDVAGLDIRPYLTDAGQDIRDTLADDCFDEGVRDHIDAGRPQLLTDDQGWKASLLDDVPPTTGAGPVLLMFGSRDDTIGIERVKAWQAEAGPAVSLRELDGVGHGGVVAAVGSNDRAWMLTQLTRPAGG